MADDWIDKMTNGNQVELDDLNNEEIDDPSNLFVQPEHYFAKPQVSCERCSDVINFWGICHLMIYY